MVVHGGGHGFDHADPGYPPLPCRLDQETRQLGTIKLLMYNWSSSVVAGCTKTQFCGFSFYLRRAWKAQAGEIWNCLSVSCFTGPTSSTSSPGVIMALAFLDLLCYCWVLGSQKLSDTVSEMNLAVLALRKLIPAHRRRRRQKT